MTRQYKKLPVTMNSEWKEAASVQRNMLSFPDVGASSSTCSDAAVPLAGIDGALPGNRRDEPTNNTDNRQKLELISFIVPGATVIASLIQKN